MGDAQAHVDDSLAAKHDNLPRFDNSHGAVLEWRGNVENAVEAGCSSESHAKARAEHSPYGGLSERMATLELPDDTLDARANFHQSDQINKGDCVLRLCGCSV